MKKIKKIIAASAMLAGSMVGITGCGEVYINFDSQTAGKEIEAFEYNQNSFQNDIQDVASSLTKNGYRVEGIYLDKDFTKPVSSLSEIKEDITLYVKWVAADIEVAFDVNGGSGEVASQYITYMTESMINSATIPTKDGYTFAGWTENADGSGKLYKNGESSFEMTGYNKVTLYAKWVANQYTITYDKNAADATGVVANSNAQFGTEFEITNAEYTRNKYTFLGWNTKADGSGVSYSEGDKIDATENITLYAMWERNTFAINFDANSGSGNNMTALELMVGSNASLTTNTYTKPGYDFIGWSTNKNASVAEYGDGSSFTLNIKNDITLYAIWQVQTYKIVYDKNAQDATGATIPMGQVNYGGTTELTSLSYTRPEYDFVGWSTNPNATEAEFEAGDTISANDILDTKTITLYAVWERNTFDIIFNSNSGNGEMDNVSIKYGTTTTLPNNVFTKAGYDFAGWAVDEESESVFDNESEYTLNVKNNITLYATWQPQTYTIVYHSNAQDAQGEVENDTILFDSSAALSNNEYTRAEYDFVGWSLEPNAVQADFEAGDLFELNSVNATKTIDLYAVWKRNTFVVSFDANGGEGTTREQKFKVNTPSNIELNNYRFTKDGYKFAGWNTNSDGSGDYYTDGSSFTLLQENDDLILYAVWKVKNYTGIIFNSNPPSAGLSVSGIVNEVDLEAGQTYTFTDSKYSLEEYDFLGWSTDPDATTADSAYNAGQEFTMPSGGDFTLYAVWERNTFVITLLANNGTSAETTQKIKYNDTENLLDNAFTNYGHVFIGWGTNNDGPTDNLIGDGQEYTLTEKADVILYARWEYGKYSVNYATNDGTETGEVAAQENVTFNSTFKLSEAVFEKTDYKQVGWTDGKGNNYSIGQEITLEEEGLTLYPVWKLNNIEISFDLLGGSGIVES